jgi:hypothetical protein
MTSPWHELREAIHRDATSVTEGHLIDRTDRALLNRFAAQPSAFPELRQDATEAESDWFSLRAAA